VNCGEYSASCSVSVSGIVEEPEFAPDYDWDDDSVSVQLTSGKALNGNGDIINYSGTWSHEEYIEVSPAFQYSIAVPGDTRVIDVYGYDENKQKTEKIINGGSGTLVTEFAVLEPYTKYIRVTVYVSSDASTLTVTRVALPAGTYGEVSMVSGYIINSTSGELQERDDGWATTDYYPATANAKYTITYAKGSFDAQYPSAYAYDADHNYLGEISGSSNNAVFTTPENTAYLRWTCLGTPTNPTYIVKQ